MYVLQVLFGQPLPPSLCFMPYLGLPFLKGKNVFEQTLMVVVAFGFNICIRQDIDLLGPICRFGAIMHLS